MKYLLEAGIQPGQWTNKDSVDYFLRFVERFVKELGDYVSEYCTINEPNVFVTDTFLEGKYPPGKKDDIRSYFKASRNLILAHLKSYRLIHKIREELGHQDTMVGMAIHMAYFEVDGNRLLTRISKKLMDYSFHKIFLKGMIDGRLGFPIDFSHPLGREAIQPLG